MPGSGKSTIGKLLAQKLQCQCYETDSEITQMARASIPEIFKNQGEARFREYEHEILRSSINTNEPSVVSTGGGVVLRADNRALLASQKWVVYLHSTPEILFERTRADHNRPLLAHNDLLSTLYKLCNERDPLYRQVAKITISSEMNTPNKVIAEILDWIEKK